MKTIYFITIALVALVFLSFKAAPLFLSKVPQQSYTVLGSRNQVEFRYYPSAVMASVITPDTTYDKAASKSFRTLAGYIFGGNQLNEKIAMTAPVRMDMSPDKTTMSFVMPEGYTLSNLPKPQSGQVILSVSAPEYVAVIRFGGWASDTKIAAMRVELSDCLAKLRIPHQNNFRYLGYNAPWDVVNRRNEIVVGIDSISVPKAQ
jgi:hypothetical protein